MIVRLTLALTFGLVCIAGCTPRPASPAPPEASLPTIGELREHRSDPDLPHSHHRGPVSPLKITCLTLPLDADLGDAWRLVESQGVEPAMGHLWRTNGMRAHLINQVLVDDFLQLLPMDPDRPELDHLAQRTIHTSQAYSPFDITDRYRQPQTCTIVMPGDEVESTVLEPGRCRLLIQSRPVDDEYLLLHLTPHHHRPKVSVKPRSVIEKRLDGRIFDELQLQARLSRRHVLIVAFHPPPAPYVAPDVESLTEPPDAATSQPAAPPDSPLESPPVSTPESQSATPTDQPPPTAIGRLILTGKRYRKPVQLLLLIVIDPPTAPPGS